MAQMMLLMLCAHTRVVCYGFRTMLYGNLLLRLKDHFSRNISLRLSRTSISETLR